MKSVVFISSPLEVPQHLREKFEEERKSGKMWNVFDAAISPQKNHNHSMWTGCCSKYKHFIRFSFGSI
jgi:hypothetical protein